MIDLTPLDVRKKKGDFRRTVRGYDPELVDDFLDMVAERLEELVKQNVALTERAEHLQEQVASYRDRERALNEALVTAQQLRSEAQAQADREADLVRREAQSQAERIVEEGHRSRRELSRQIEALEARKLQFMRAFRTLLERYLSELEVDEGRPARSAGPETARSKPSAASSPDLQASSVPQPPVTTPSQDGDEPEDEPRPSDWLSSLVAKKTAEGDRDEVK
jgi:DivIVA domain-containing protein